MEQRWGERLPVNVPVRVSNHAFSMRDGRLTDLSVSGAQLTVDFELRLLSRVEVTVVLPYRSKHEAPTISAFITRKGRNEFGLEWCEFAPIAVRDLLRAAVQHPFASLRRHAMPAVLRARSAGSLLKHSE
jgi:PilZ domain